LRDDIVDDQEKITATSLHVVYLSHTVQCVLKSLGYTYSAEK